MGTVVCIQTFEQGMPRERGGVFKLTLGSRYAFKRLAATDETLAHVMIEIPRPDGKTVNRSVPMKLWESFIAGRLLQVVEPE